LSLNRNRPILIGRSWWDVCSRPHEWVSALNPNWFVACTMHVDKIHKRLKNSFLWLEVFWKDNSTTMIHGHKPKHITHIPIPVIIWENEITKCNHVLVLCWCKTWLHITKQHIYCIYLCESSLLFFAICFLAFDISRLVLII
jgi:hypothetical protein